MVAAAGVIALIVLVASGGTSSSSSTPAVVASRIGPIGLSAKGLRDMVNGTVHQPVYWAGPRRGDVYELTRTTTGNAYVRYLPHGVPVGDPATRFLIVATYPFPNALPRLKGVANGGGVTLPDGAFVLPDVAYPKSVHIAFPGANDEVEVYNPSPAVAQRVALSGAIRRVR